MPRRIVDSDDEEHLAQEIDEHEDLELNSASRRRVQKPSTKQKEIGKRLIF